MFKIEMVMSRINRRRAIGLMAGSTLSGFSQAARHESGNSGWPSVLDTPWGSIRLHTILPQDPDGAIVVLHGKRRNAVDYKAAWVTAARRLNVAVIVPEFDATRFPGWRAYNMAGMIDSNNNTTAQDQWLFQVLSDLQCMVRQSLGQIPLDIFGHSAGAQLAYRYAMFADNLDADMMDTRFVVANAGWYTLPDNAVPFPYGLDNSPAMVDLPSFFGRSVVMLVGSLDTDDQHITLRRDGWSDRQGHNRLDRAQNCFDFCRAMAERLQVPFRWQLHRIAGVDHSGAGMATAWSELDSSTD